MRSFRSDSGALVLVSVMIATGIFFSGCCLGKASPTTKKFGDSTKKLPRQSTEYHRWCGCAPLFFACFWFTNTPAKSPQARFELIVFHPSQCQMPPAIPSNCQVQTFGRALQRGYACNEFIHTWRVSGASHGWFTPSPELTWKSEKWNLRRECDIPIFQPDSGQCMNIVGICWILSSSSGMGNPTETIRNMGVDMLPWDIIQPWLDSFSLLYAPSIPTFWHWGYNIRTLETNMSKFPKFLRFPTLTLDMTLNIYIHRVKNASQLQHT